MQIDIKYSDAPARFPGSNIVGATITDGRETLRLSVVKVNWMTLGTLRAADGRTWAQNSVAALNLLILHARAAVTVAELLEDLGDCDETRIEKARQ